MRVGIITWWRNNYGSVLQAFALQQELSQYEDIKYEIVCQFGKRATSLDNVLDKIKNVGFVETFKRAFWKLSFKGLRQRNRNIQEFVDEKLKVSDQQYNEENIAESNTYYDAYICGSDQIWNPDLVATDSMYWLPFVENGKKKIAYAPSFGAKTVTTEQSKQIRENLSSFEAISCREISGSKVINQIIGENKCTTVLDPTLLIPRSCWDEMSDDRICQEKYIFAYMLRGTSKQRKHIEEFARKRNLKIVSIPFLDYEKIDLYDLKFGDYKLWDADPADFISAIRHAEYVFCDSFHCIVFSILYHRPFCVFPKIGADGKVKVSQIGRMADLLELVGIKNRIVFEDSEVDMDAEIDWDSSDKRIQEARCVSEDYLKKALGM
jgi:hypothetical protein